MAGPYFWVGGTGTLTNVSTANLSASSGGTTGAGPCTVADDFIVDAASGTGIVTIAGTAVMKNCTLTPGTGITNIVLSGNIAPAGTLKYLGANGTTATLLISSSVIGTPRTITAAAIDAASDFTDFMDITIAGAAAPANVGTRIGNALGNSGITFTPSVPQYWKHTNDATSKNWSDATRWFLGTNGTGGAGRVPLPQDDPRFDVNSFPHSGCTVVADMLRLGRNIDWTGVTNNPVWQINTFTFYGSLTCISGMSTLGNQVINMIGSGARTITSAGLVWLYIFNVLSPYGGSVTLQDAFTISLPLAGVFRVYSGTFDANGFSVTAPTIAMNNAQGLVTLNMGSGVWTATGANGWQGHPSMTVNAGASTIKLTDATSAIKTFLGGGKTYNIVQLSGAGSGSFDFTGSNTINNLIVDTLPHTVRFTATTTTTVNGMSIDPANVLTLGSITTAQHTLKKTGGGKIVIPNAVISRSTATPPDTFFAPGGTDGGNNLGWQFNQPVLRGLMLC